MRPVSLKLIYLTLFAAYMLYLLPWAGFGLLLRPDFVLLVLLYWMLRAPHLCNVGTAWMMGLWLDIASGSLFGQYALAYSVTAFFAIYYQRRLVLFSAWQQVGYVMLLLLVSQIVLLVIKLMAGNALPGWCYFLSSLSGVLLWQLLVFSRVIDPDAKNAS
ncbi:MAG: rod shape-determining protein MreD [Methylophilaceae bacterium]|uniref:rod shape-determining protein MreD n=1 Tax=Methylobacillus sp. MM3 TaxID=1848039 RepID=UPI0007E203EC|nr:rod shape-determining protein MreD [Methylobacillus sp. MM3]OAJ70590.1 rod shape-determining protein MreD [Methylobacillus sp. MM3]